MVSVEDCVGRRRNQITNFELLKNMSIEELAVTIMCPNDTGMAEIECDKSDTRNCCLCCLEWLMKESKEWE